VVSSSSHPRHVAIIMDGNGRWAELRRRPRTFGHLRGARIAREVIEACAELGIENLTLYAFSTENWLRPLEEVSFLMALLSRHLRRERETLIKNNIRFRAIGELDRLPASVRAEVDKTIADTSHCTGLLLTFALSYGGRQDLVEANRQIARKVAQGELDPESISEETVAAHLATAGQPDPDLVIRTSGESRLSNFLLWQNAYAEFLVLPTLWPDFSREKLDEALAWYSQRERRFGKVSSQVESPATV
jgi:undecaprenyl diphosphate synthase